MIKFFKIIWMFAIPISCGIVSLFFFGYYFFYNDTDIKTLVLAIVGLIAGIIWFKTLYKGYKLMKAAEKGVESSEKQKTAETSTAKYWKRFLWVVVVLFIIGLLIRYFLKF